MKKTVIAFILFAIVMLIPGCQKDGTGSSGSSSSTGSGKGSTQITNLSAGRSSVDIWIKCSVQASGVVADEVNEIGFYYSTDQSTNGRRVWIGGHKLSGTGQTLPNNCASKTTYYVKAYLKTSSGTVYSNPKNVKTP